MPQYPAAILRNAFVLPGLPDAFVGKVLCRAVRTPIVRDVEDVIAGGVSTDGLNALAERLKRIIGDDTTITRSRLRRLRPYRPVCTGH
jgi:hypothetical protein